MVKIEVLTQTTYVIDLPIDSFEEISEESMPLSKSDGMIIDYLAEHLDVGVDKIIKVIPR